MNNSSFDKNSDIELNLTSIQRLGPRTLMANLSRSDGEQLIYCPGDYVSLMHDAFCEKLEFSLPIASHPSLLKKEGTIDVLFYLKYGSILNNLVYTPRPGFNLTLKGVHRGFKLREWGNKCFYLCVAEGPGISFFSSLSPVLVRSFGSQIVQFTPEKNESFFDDLLNVFTSPTNNFKYTKIIDQNVSSGISYIIPKEFNSVLERVEAQGADIHVLIAGSKTFISSIKSVLINKKFEHALSQTFVCTDTQVIPEAMELSHDD